MNANSDKILNSIYLLLVLNINYFQHMFPIKESPSCNCLTAFKLRHLVRICNKKWKNKIIESGLSIEAKKASESNSVKRKPHDRN